MFINRTARYSCSGGFSLLELLLVLTLAPIVFFAVYSNFSYGVRLWQRLQVPVPAEDRLIFSVKTERDFSNAMHYSNAPFDGEKEEAGFVTGIEAAPELGGARAIGRVRYYYSGSAHAILRQTQDFSEMYRENGGKTDRMLKGVASLEFFYLTYDKNSSKFEWDSAYRPEKPDDLPLAVRMIYQMEGASESFEKTFSIPAGGSLQ